MAQEPIEERVTAHVSRFYRLTDSTINRMLTTLDSSAVYSAIIPGATMKKVKSFQTAIRMRKQMLVPGKKIHMLRFDLRVRELKLPCFDERY